MSTEELQRAVSPKPLPVTPEPLDLHTTLRSAPESIIAKSTTSALGNAVDPGPLGSDGIGPDKSRLTAEESAIFEARIGSANRELITTPTKPTQPDTGSDFYEVRVGTLNTAKEQSLTSQHGLLSATPVLKKTTPPKHSSLAPSKSPDKQGSPVSLLDVVKDRFLGKKNKLEDEEALHAARKSKDS